MSYESFADLPKFGSNSGAAKSSLSSGRSQPGGGAAPSSTDFHPDPSDRAPWCQRFPFSGAREAFVNARRKAHKAFVEMCEKAAPPYFSFGMFAGWMVGLLLGLAIGGIVAAAGVNPMVIVLMMGIGAVLGEILGGLQAYKALEDGKSKHAAREYQVLAAVFVVGLLGTSLLAAFLNPVSGVGLSMLACCSLWFGELAVGGLLSMLMTSLAFKGYTSLKARFSNDSVVDEGVTNHSIR